MYLTLNRMHATDCLGLNFEITNPKVLEDEKSSWEYLVCGELDCLFLRFMSSFGNLMVLYFYLL